MEILEPVSHEVRLANQELLKATYYSEINRVKEILEGDVDVKARDIYGNTALIIASTKGHDDILELLLRQPKIDVNACNQRGMTALHESCKNGYESITNSLLLERGINVDAVNNDDDFPLIFAAEGGHAKCVELLLYRGADYGEMGDVLFKVPGIGEAMINGLQKIVDRYTSFIGYIKSDPEYLVGASSDVWE